MPKRINDLVEATTIASSDLLVVETSTGTKKVQFGNMMPTNSHNAIFRGKNLGTIDINNIDTFITEHGVSTGTFTDLYLGDYFTASYDGTNKTFRVAGFDTHMQQGDTNVITRHHIEIVPDQALTSAPMNSTNTTGVSANEENESGLGAFAGSDMFQLVLPTVNTNLEAIFGGHLFSYREILSNAMDANAPSGAHPTWKGASSNWTWYDVKAVLMSETEVYGSAVWSSSGYDTGCGIHQIPLFAIEPRFINLRYWYWLRSVASAAGFCNSGTYGDASYHYAAYSSSVRPRFLLG